SRQQVAGRSGPEGSGETGGPTRRAEAGTGGPAIASGADGPAGPAAIGTTARATAGAAVRATTGRATVRRPEVSQRRGGCHAKSRRPAGRCSTEADRRVEAGAHGRARSV